MDDMAITDELREYTKRFLSQWCWDKYKLTAIADRIDAEHEAALLNVHTDLMAAHGWVRLPKDADGEYIHVGDRMELKGSDFLFGEASFEVHSMRCGECGWEVYDRLGDRYAPSLLRHHHAPTVEDVLRQFLGECESAANLGYDEVPQEVFDDYVKRLRLAGDAE